MLSHAGSSRRSRGRRSRASKQWTSGGEEDEEKDDSSASDHYVSSDSGIEAAGSRTTRLSAVDIPAGRSARIVKSPLRPPGAGSGSAALPRASLAQGSASGTTRHTAKDPRTGVLTNYEIGPSRQLAGRQQANKRITGRRDGDGSSTSGYRGYQRSGDPEADYVQGRMIEVLIVPPEDNTLSAVSRLTPIQGLQHLRTRRFVILKRNDDGTQGFRALPIKTNRGYGVAGPGVVKSHYSIIYSRGREEPQPTQAELTRPGESGMRSTIEVVPLDRTRPLDPMARLDYFDVHNFDDNVDYVALYGRVARDHVGLLIASYRSVWSDIAHHSAGPTNTPPPAPAPIPQQSQDTDVVCISTQIRELRAQAAHYRLSRVPTLAEPNIRYFAQNSSYYQTWLQSLRARWEREFGARNEGVPPEIHEIRGGDIQDRPPEAPSRAHSSSGEDSSDDDDDEDEEDV